MAVGAALLAGCADDPAEETAPSLPSARECAALRDHMIDVRLQGVSVDRAQHQAALESALGTSFLTTCGATLSRAQVLCGIAAIDAAALAACATP